MDPALCTLGRLLPEGSSFLNNRGLKSIRCRIASTRLKSAESRDESSMKRRRLFIYSVSFYRIIGLLRSITRHEQRDRGETNRAIVARRTERLEIFPNDVSSLFVSSLVWPSINYLLLVSFSLFPFFFSFLYFTNLAQRPPTFDYVREDFCLAKIPKSR